MNGIPMGGYLEGDSFLHKADGFVKLLCVGFLMAAAILANTAQGYLFFGAVLLGLVKFSGIGVKHAFAGVGQLRWFLLLILLMNAFFFTQATPLWSWWIFRFSAQGLAQGCNVICHLVFVMVLANLFMATTSPLEISGALEYILLPLGYLGVPVRDVALILGVALQFIPTLAQEVQMIKKAQMARGAGFESGTLLQKAQSVIPLVVPMFVAAFRRADELALAMEARGYRGGQKPSRYYKPHIDAKAVTMIVLCGTICTVQAVVF